MPCTDGGVPYGPSDHTERSIRDREAITRLACDRCKEIEARGGEVPAWAQEWWVSHQAEDRARLARDRQARHEAEVRKTALAKLTPEEREELGL